MKRKVEMVTITDLRTLENIGIIEARSIVTGQPTKIHIAVQAPELCRIHAMSDKVFDMACDGDEVILAEVIK